MKKASYLIYVVFFMVLMSRIDTDGMADAYLNVLIFSFAFFASLFGITFVEENKFTFKNKFLNWLFS